MSERPPETPSTGADHDDGANEHSDHELDGDSSDVVTGEIGAAHLVEPDEAEELSADLDELPDLRDSVDPAGDRTVEATETPRT